MQLKQVLNIVFYSPRKMVPNNFTIKKINIKRAFLRLYLLTLSRFNCSLVNFFNAYENFLCYTEVLKNKCIVFNFWYPSSVLFISHVVFYVFLYVV